MEGNDATSCLAELELDVLETPSQESQNTWCWLIRDGLHGHEMLNGIAWDKATQSDYSDCDYFFQAGVQYRWNAHEVGIQSVYSQNDKEEGDVVPYQLDADPKVAHMWQEEHVPDPA